MPDENTTEAPASLSLDEQLEAVEAEARASREDEPGDEELDVATEAPKAKPEPAKETKEAKEAPKGDAPTAKLLKTKAAELTRLEMGIEAKRGELVAREAAMTEKIASADAFAAFRKALKDDPAAALELIGEDISDFSERLSKAVFGHDAGAKKLTGVERELTEIKAKLAAREDTEAKREADAKHEREEAARAVQAKTNYLDLTARDAGRWPSLQRVETEELATAAGNYRIRMQALTGMWPTFEDTNDALEEHAARELAKREATRSPAPAKPAARPASRTLVPEAAAERGNGRELTLDEKLEMVERQEREAAHRASA